MNLYVVPVYCDVCGGDGVASINQAHHLFRAPFVHTNPFVCKWVLEQRQRNLEQKLATATQKLEEAGIPA